jgi:hypothetical protein
MIRGPWPLAPCGTRYAIPLEEPYLTPWLDAFRVALRVSQEDFDKLRRGPGTHGVITDLDTMKRYTLRGIPCSWPSCYCDAEIEEVHG